MATLRRLRIESAIIQRDGDLHRFLHRDIGSEEALTIVLFLFEHRDRDWTPDELRSGLSIDLDATASSSAIVNRRIELRLGDLIERGIVQQNATTQRYTLASVDPAHFAFVEQLFINASDLDEARALIYLRPRGLDTEADGKQTAENPSESPNS